MVYCHVTDRVSLGIHNILAVSVSIQTVIYCVPSTKISCQLSTLEQNDCSFARIRRIFTCIVQSTVQSTAQSTVQPMVHSPAHGPQSSFYTDSLRNALCRPITVLSGITKWTCLFNSLRYCFQQTFNHN